MDIWAAAAAELNQAEIHGRLVHTSADGRRTYIDDAASRITIVSPSAPTLKVTVVGVDLSALC